MSSPTNARLGTPATANLTIIDDDAVPPQQPPGGYDISATYDTIGNLTSKSDVGAYTYGMQSASCLDGALSKPHAVVSAGSRTFCYDKLGNMRWRNGDDQGWNTENRLLYMYYSNAVDTFSYDGDGERLTRTTTAGTQTTTTTYVEGLFERDASGAQVAQRSFYMFNGQVVAQRTKQWSGPTFTESVTYLHGDHLGSISLATGETGVRLGNQDYDPWGKVRPGNTITQTPLNYTGQHLDASGLLYYHARLYDSAAA